MKLADKWWLLFNKKVPSRNRAYLLIAVSWFSYGGIFGWALDETAKSIGASPENSIYLAVAMSLITVLTAFFCWNVYKINDKRGYIDALYQQHLQNWIHRHNSIKEQTKKEVYK